MKNISWCQVFENILFQNALFSINKIKTKPVCKPQFLFFIINDVAIDLKYWFIKHLEVLIRFGLHTLTNQVYAY